MQIIPFPAHYQSVYTHFDISSFSLISCTPKTILLRRKNHTFARRICNTQKTNTLRTFREGISNGLRMRGEHSAKHQRSPTKWAANIPPGVGADSSRPYPNIFKYAYPHYQLRVFTSLNTYFHITTRTFPFVISWVHHICGHDKSAPTAANGLR